ncbi:CHC2 zinc finger domain-containing protein [uncultured Azohydromonas sp.]|jgi:DNA primase (bacterial type)|uniref:CHC2 zinc finger domain-containing protein n=1 Tax=uncultured Azohydromonas sp. TaxID=487342 RepID=UPI0026051A4A|nr:CHC2 zinc finger domain-containing protein [uncultured Azohydromonas sp.]
MGEFRKDLLPEPTSYFEAQGLALTGRGKWRTTRCDFHDGSDSMRINTESGGWCCMACGAHGGDVLAFHMQHHGLEFVEAARELGAYVDDGKPHRGPVKPAGLSPRAALEVVAFEALLVAVAAGNLAHGVVLNDQDRQRLMQAAGRIDLIAQEVLTCA